MTFICTVRTGSDKSQSYKTCMFFGPYSEAYMLRELLQANFNHLQKTSMNVDEAVIVNMRKSVFLREYGSRSFVCPSSELNICFR
jgi:hypothetical protein